MSKNKHDIKSDHLKRKKFSSRLVFRVFTTSLLCLIVPLIIYSLVITRIFYDRRSAAVFRALSNVTTEKIHLFNQVLDFTFASMYSVNLILAKGLLDPADIKELLVDYADEFFIDSAYYLTPVPNSDRFEVSFSSQPNLPKLDYTRFVENFGLDKLKYKYFIANNLNGEKVLYLAHTDYDLNQNVVGILLFDIHFETLVSSIFYLQEWDNMVVSLLNEDNIVMASSDRHYDGFSVTINQEQGYTVPNTIMLEPEARYDNSYVYELANVAYLAVVKPIPNSNMKLMTVVPKMVLYSPIQSLIEQMVILLLCILLLGGGLLYIFLRRLSKPINSIHHCMRMVSEGDLTYKYKPMGMGFEINSIGEVFNETVDKLVGVMNEVKTAKVNEEVLAKELSLGQKVQHSLLPRFLNDTTNLEASGKFVSAKQVGGDCYDFYPLEDKGKTFFFISDTAGKGIMACLYALGLRSLLHAFSKAHDSLEKVIIDTNNAFVVDTSDTGVFVTAWCGIYDEKTHKLRYAGVGHPPTLLKKKNGTIEMISTSGIAFGAMHIDDVEIKEVNLEPGDLLVLYTDGVIEAQNSAGQYYTIERLVALLRSIQSEDPYEVTDLIHESVMQFSQGEEQFDDLTLLVIKVNQSQF
ncbi:MAG: SpoIIE family protein phosphatase [Rhabdochlamydiaceae bacterium]|nr:SpoIIE family protein phosphatase [Candidatus Amphrikana amoebophyrae]